ncbi:MAG: S26 family signal peptidase [Treponema sp.]|nr:S26 family signal peptidase [Treponema sp.]
MDFFDRIQQITETCLSRRAKKRRIRKEKQKEKNKILDWLGAFLWAAGMVLLINQYLVQAYQIPTGSMIDTLNIGDHIFVNKLIYGPELLPGFVKLPSPIQPQRNEVIIFENPTFISRGTAFEIAQRIIHMLTLSIVDIGRDEAGEPSVQFLIKRAIGQGGDRFISEGGSMKILFAGEDRWVSEQEYNEARGWNHNIHRLMTPDQYPALIAAGQAAGWSGRGLHPSAELLDRARLTTHFPDFFTHERARLETLRRAAPGEGRYAMLLARHRLGWFVPEGRVFPVGDSRDNSRDGRFFGPVRSSKVLGRAMVVYWPIWQMRGIN